MYKVKIFGESSRKGLETSINSWLEVYSINLIDIKYVVSETNYSNSYQYAMVIYEVKKMMVNVELDKVFDPKELAFAIRVAAVTPENFLSEYKPDEYQKYYNENINEPFILSPMEFLFVKYLKNPEESEKCFNLVVNKEQSQNDI